MFAINDKVFNFKHYTVQPTLSKFYKLHLFRFGVCYSKYETAAIQVEILDVATQEISMLWKGYPHDRCKHSVGRWL